MSWVKKYDRHDKQLIEVFDAIRSHTAPPEPKKRKIGFRGGNMLGQDCKVAKLRFIPQVVPQFPIVVLPIKNHDPEIGVVSTH